MVDFRYCEQNSAGTKIRFGRYFGMKKTTRKPLNRMTVFVISIFALAIVVAAIYLIGFTPGETPIAQ